MDLTVPCISKLLGVSVKTVHLRMQEWGLSIKGRYSSVTDNELDSLVSEIKRDSRNLGKSYTSTVTVFIVSVMFSGITSCSLSGSVLRHALDVI